MRTLRLLLLLTPLLVCACAQDGIDSTETPSVQLVPDRLVFAKSAIGVTDERVLEIRNVGTGLLLIADLTLELDPDATYELFYRADPAADWRLAVDASGRQAPPLFRVEGGASLFLALTVTPGANALANGSLRIRTNAPDGTFTVPIEHTPGGPELYVDPLSVDFGRVPAGERAVAQIEVTNIGQAPLTLDDIILDGSQDFAPILAGRDPRRQRGTLADPDDDGEPGLAPGNSVELEVRYAPLAEGPDRAALRLLTNDPQRPETTIALTANAAAPCLDVEPGAIEFAASLVNRTDARPVDLVSCGGGTLLIDDVALSPDSDPAFAITDLPPLPAELPAVDPDGPPATTRFRVEFTPRSERVHEGRVIIVSNDPVTPSRTISVLGRGVQNACPLARASADHLAVVPLDVVALDGTPSIDPDGPEGRPVQYRWVVISGPEGSTSIPVERFFNPLQPASGGEGDDLTTPTAQFFAELVGTYVLELRVIDHLGLSSEVCETSTRVVVEVVPDRAIHVQLTWSADGDADPSDRDGADLDLHLLHPNAESWFSTPYDCHYTNPTPDWGQLENPADDPSLDIDDVDGEGPENITLDLPEDTDVLGAPYIVGVHAYDLRNPRADQSFGPARPIVRIYIRGALAWDSTVETDGVTLEETDDFWDVAAIEWPSGTITTRDRFHRP